MDANGPGFAGQGSPCAQDEQINDATALTYTTEPLQSDATLAGPLTADLWAAFTRTDGMLVATVADVAPDGTATWLSSGMLRASQRAVDWKRTRTSANGLVVRPYHPLRQGDARPVEVGSFERYLIELNPTAAKLAKGHRIRLTLTTADSPSVLPAAAKAAGMAGGMVTIAHSRVYPSHLVLPLVPAP